MKCKQCGYILWRLRERQCPECGSSFAPSEYKYSPGAVRFCCPDCSQAYYGTSAAGHLEPRGFACEKCARPLHMDDMVLEPEPGREGSAMASRPVPWEDKPAGGFFKRLWLTASAGMVKPTSLLSENDDASPGAATGYYLVLTGLLTLSAGVTAGIFLILMFGVLGANSRAGGGGPTFGAMSGLMVGMTFCQVIGTFFVWQVMLLVWTIFAHLILKFSGVKAGGFGRTWTALAYSSGPLLVCVIPVCGPYLTTPAGIWWMVSAVFTIRNYQRVSTGRAVCSVVIPPVTLTIAAVVAYVAFIFAIVGGAMGTAMSAAQQTTGQGNTQTVGAALFATYGRDGEWPAHASQLLLEGAMTSQDFITNPRGVAGWQSTIGGHTLITFDTLASAQRSQAVATEAAGMDTVSQYRVGDLVFCYAGLDPAVHAPDLWVVVSAPLDGAGWMGQVRFAHAYLLDGSVVELNFEGMKAEVETQNTIREQAGLPLVEDPFSVLPGMTVNRLPSRDEPEDGG